MTLVTDISTDPAKVGSQADLDMARINNLGLDNTRSLGDNRGHRDQHGSNTGPALEHRSQVAAQTPGFHVTFGGNMGHGC